MNETTRRNAEAAASMTHLTFSSEYRALASYRRNEVHRHLASLQITEQRPALKIVMKDIKRLARNFFTEEEYAQFIEEQKALLAHEPDTESDLPPLSFMLFMHDIYGLSRDEMGLVDGSVRLTLKAGKRIAQQRLRESDVTPDLQDQIMEVIQVLDSHEE